MSEEARARAETFTTTDLFNNEKYDTEEWVRARDYEALSAALVVAERLAADMSKLAKIERAGRVVAEREREKWEDGFNKLSDAHRIMQGRVSSLQDELVAAKEALRECAEFFRNANLGATAIYVEKKLAALSAGGEGGRSDMHGALTVERIEDARETLLAAFALLADGDVAGAIESDALMAMTEAMRNLTAIAGQLHGQEVWERICSA